MNKHHNQDKKPKNYESFRVLAQVSHIGLTMAVTVLVGVYLGKYIDRFLGTSPWFLIIFSLLGAVAALRVLFNIAKDKE